MIRLAIIAAGLVLASAGTAQAAEREITRLGAPAVLAGPGEVDYTFDLPAGATQGPSRWYLVKLRYRVRFAEDSGRGFAWVTSETNGRTSAQIEYTTSRTGVRRTTVDLLNGQRERPGRSRTDEVTYSNYLQYQGVRPGPNRWAIKLEQSGRARVERLEILPGTAIVETDRGPYPLALTVALDGGRPEAGERFTLVAKLAARSGTVDDVVVRARGLTPVGPAERRVGRITSDATEVRFEFIAGAEGTYPITIEADSAANHPNAGVQVRVGPATGAPGTPALWALASLPALLMMAWLVSSRRRRAVA